MARTDAAAKGASTAMAATSGASNSALKQTLVPSELEARLRREPYAIRFFQAVRLLERLFPERKPVGRFVNPSGKIVPVSPNPSLAFPAIEIHKLQSYNHLPHHTTDTFFTSLSSTCYFP